MEREKRNRTAEREVAAVMRLLGGEEPEAVATDIGVPLQQLEAWRRIFLAAGSKGLNEHLDPAEERLRVDVDLLGAPRLRCGERRLDWRLRRAFEAVAFLALAEGMRATKAELFVALWPDASEETVRKNFHPTLSEARRTLASGLGKGGESLVYQGGYYALSPKVDWVVDGIELESCARRVDELSRQAGAAAEALELGLRGWNLYRGPLLSNYDSEWVKQRRNDLRRCYLALLWQIGKLSEELGREQAALDAYRAVLLEEPLEERAHQVVMRLYGQKGRRDLVRRQFVRLQDLLEELNVEPMQGTQELYHQLMR